MTRLDSEDDRAQLVKLARDFLQASDAAIAAVGSSTVIMEATKNPKSASHEAVGKAAAASNALLDFETALVNKALIGISSAVKLVKLPSPWTPLSISVSNVGRFWPISALARYNAGK